MTVPMMEAQPVQVQRVQAPRAASLVKTRLAGAWPRRPPAMPLWEYCGGDWGSSGGGVATPLDVGSTLGIGVGVAVGVVGAIGVDGFAAAVATVALVRAPSSRSFVAGELCSAGGLAPLRASQARSMRCQSSSLSERKMNPIASNAERAFSNWVGSMSLRPTRRSRYAVSPLSGVNTNDDKSSAPLRITGSFRSLLIVPFSDCTAYARRCLGRDA